MSGISIHRSVPAAALIVAVTAMVGGCGIGTDDSPRALPASTTTSTSVPTENPGPERAVFWFVQAEKLVPALRPVSAFSPDAFIETLLVPPTSVEGEGLSNAIPAGTELLGTQTLDGITEVDLSEGFEDVVGPGSSRAIGQIVMTLTGLDEVDGVRFAVDGEPIDVTSLDPDRGTVSVVNACDYSELLAEPLGETTQVSPVQEEILENRRTELRDTCPS
ncbi:MAG: GerMN domain-containing protein [Microthrixaceae bacterium]